MTGQLRLPLVVERHLSGTDEKAERAESCTATSAKGYQLASTVLQI